jgi:methyl-accepting chemotaxis protein
MKPSVLSSRRSLARQVALQVFLVLVVALAAVSAVMAWLAVMQSRERLVRETGLQVQALVDALEALDATAGRMAERVHGPFRQKFARTFELDEAGSRLLSWGMPLNGETGELDAFQQVHGGTASIYMRKGDDFERIATTLRTTGGARAVGLRLGTDHPAYAAMRAGGAYTDRVAVDGVPYMAHFEAVRNPAGQVVGIVAIGFELGDFQAAADRLVQGTTFFDRGGTVVIEAGTRDEDAVFVVHPTATGRRVLEVAPQAAPVLATLRATPEATVTDAVALRDPGLQAPWLVKRQTRDGRWWVVAEVSQREATASLWATMRVVWVVLAVMAVLLGLAVFWIQRRGVVRPLAQLTDAVSALAQGDLTRAFRVNRNDEVGQLMAALDHMRARFLGIVRDLQVAADGIGTASAEIALGNQDLSRRTEQTASNLQQTAASMEQLNGTVRNSADAARQANQLAASAAEIAARGGQVVGEVVSTMQAINHSSHKIGDIIGVIDGIAFQTNILALNAAVEAARAGEQGRGFAVVAAEVRNLAQRSAEAAKEIKQLIEASVDKVEAGTRLVGDAGSTMSQIVESVQRVCDIIGEISAASVEQSEGIGQVNVAVSQLDQMTQQNAALVEQSAAAAQSLKEQAQRLAQVVQVFRVDGMVAHPAPTPPRTAPSPVQAARPEGGHTKAPTPVAAPAATPRPPAPPTRPTPPSEVATATPGGVDDDWESF